MIGFKYGGIHTNVYGIFAKSVNRPILPSMRKKQISIPGRHGSIDFYNDTYDKRIIDVDIKYKSNTFAEMRTNARAIAMWLYTYSSTKTLIFDDEPDKYYNARVLSSIDFASTMKLGETSIQFECQPLAYAVAASTQAKAWALDGDTDNYSNTANYSTNATITISGTVTNPQITNNTTGLSMTISAALTAQTLIVNTENYTIEIDGTNYLHKMSGNWFGLVTGTNTFVFNGTAPNANITFDWVDNWL